MQKIITDDLELFLGALPAHLSQPLQQQGHLDELIEIVMDLGRLPEARYHHKQHILTNAEITTEDIDYVAARIGLFGEDNRAGIERTLHRISAIRNRAGNIIGFSCRVGRAVFGNIKLIQDLVESGKSTMLLGRPGVGKTTMLREVARVLADELEKRVVIVDTSNEIAGDGDIPHPAIGRARRMQVTRPSMQHAVMIEAVENHMPEVIIIDEISTELETQAARTIAERGVQLVATAHGNTLENLILNPTLSDLIGGIQTVTLSDEEARRRRTQKSILERKAPPTFDIMVEIQSWDRVAIHPDVTNTVDAILRRRKTNIEMRWFDENGEVQTEGNLPTESYAEQRDSGINARVEIGRKKFFLFGIDRNRFGKIAGKMQLPYSLVDNLNEADLLMIPKTHYRKNPQILASAEGNRIPVYVLRNNTVSQIEQSLSDLYEINRPAETVVSALQEAEEAISSVKGGESQFELSPQNSFIRRLQHQLAGKHSLQSESYGREPKRRVKIFGIL